jgi:hypothetical protein
VGYHAKIEINPKILELEAASEIYFDQEPTPVELQRQPVGFHGNGLHKGMMTARWL